MNKLASQKRSFTTIFLIEMWERFGYYGMAALLVLFMVDHLGFGDIKANLTWGAFTALLYASPSIGGWIGDKILGSRRTMILGALVLFSGYVLLIIPSNNLQFMYIALSVIIIGNGFFKANAANLVRKIYEGEDSKIDSAFTLYYMAVNIGSTASMLATPWIKDHWGWHEAFAVCAVGMILGILNFILMHKTLNKVGSQADQEPINWKSLFYVIIGAVILGGLVSIVLADKVLAVTCVWLAGLIILCIYIYMLIRCASSERPGLFAALILTVQTILFFIFYQQMATSLTLFALRNVTPAQYLLGFHLFNWSPAQFQALNPMWIMILSPLLVIFYNRLVKNGHDFPIAVKFSLGFVAVALGFFVIGWSRNFAHNGMISPWFMVAGYGFYSLGELLVSGLGLAMIARYAPARMSGFMMGSYFVATGISQYLGSVVANFAHIPRHLNDPLQSLAIYTKLFMNLGWLAVIGMLIAFSMLPVMKKLSSQHHAFKNA